MARQKPRHNSQRVGFGFRRAPAAFGDQPALMRVIDHDGSEEAMQMTKISIKTSHGSIAIAETGGEGIPLVMLHANSLSKEGFRPQIEALRDVRRVIAVDLPGHGDSSNAIDPRRTYNIPGYADAIKEALAAIEVQRFVVLGHSLGGHVALEMIAVGAGVAGVMIFGTPPVANTAEGLQSGFIPGPDMEYTGKPELSAAEVSKVVTLAVGQAADKDGFFSSVVRRTDGLARQYMIEAALAGKGSNQRQVIETTMVPLAVVNGEDDPVVNLDYVDSLSYANLWTNKPLRIPGAGHAPHREKSKQFNEILIRFLSEMA